MKSNVIEEYFKTHKNDKKVWEKCYIHEKIFDSIRECIAIYKVEDEGNDFIIVDFNSAAELTENQERRDIIGKSMLEVFPEYKESGLFDVFKKVYKTGKPEEYPVKYSADERITAGWRENYIFKIPEDDLIVTIYEDVSKLKKAEESLRESKKEHEKMLDEILNLSKFPEENPHPVLRVNSDFIITYANVASKNLLSHWKTIKGGIIPNEYFENIKLALKSGKHTLIDIQCDEIIYSLVIAPIVVGNYVNIYGRDITLRKKYEEGLISVNRMYAMLSQMNQLIIRSTERDELFEKICKIAVDYGKFRFAWIGTVDYETKRIVPYKFAGIEAGYLKNIFISISEDLPEGKGPTGRAVREKKCITANNIPEDPDYAPWRAEALERGYGSAATVPFFIDNKVYGVLCFFAPEANFFDKEEIRLLEEISSDLTYALNQMKTKEEKENSI